MYKRLYFIGIAAYVLMLLFSIVFYRERIIFLDSAFTSFNIIRENSIYIGTYRFGDVFSQLLPVLARRTGLSLNVIIISYSIGFMLLYFVCYFICGSVLKQFKFALVILLLNVMFVSDTFYYVASQLPQGMAIFIVILALTNSRKLSIIRPLQTAFLILLIITVAFYHPLLVFVIVNAIIFFTLQKIDFPDKRLLKAVFVTFILAFALKTILFRTPYEKHAMSGLKNFITFFPNYFTLYSDKQFLYNCVTKYYWIPILSITIAILYTLNKEWEKLTLFLVSFLGYLFLVTVSYPSAATPSFYMENLYLPIGSYISLPFVFDVLPKLEKKRAGSFLFSLIVFAGCARLYATHKPYTARLNFERKILTQYGAKKMVLNSSAVADTLQMLWGTPYEFLLLSVSEHGKPASIIIDDHPEKLEGLTTLKNGLRVNWETYPYSSLPTKYFNFTDTTSGYIINP